MSTSSSLYIGAFSYKAGRGSSELEFISFYLNLLLNCDSVNNYWYCPFGVGMIWCQACSWNLGLCFHPSLALCPYAFSDSSFIQLISLPWDLSFYLGFSCPRLLFLVWSHLDIVGFNGHSLVEYVSGHCVVSGFVSSD